MNSKVYDVLKYVALVALPAAGAAYFGLAAIWHLPAAEEIVGSVSVVDVFLGVFINKSSKDHAITNPRNSELVGDLIVQQNSDGTPVGMRMVGTRDPMIFQDMTTVAFNVKREQSLPPV